jgi:Histidine kinase-, DNA gyrase B-, and HSP90-like ATPase
MKLEHKAGKDIIYELAIRLYPSSLESFREAISNSLDEGSNKVEIQVSIKEIVFDDWGEGIKNIEKFATFGEAMKANLGGEIIGEKGLGKLSLLRLAEKVNFRTNNGEYGIDIIMTPEYLDYDIGSVNKFLDHKGTRIIIPTPKEVPPIEDLSNYLKRSFGLRIVKGTEIILNGIRLESKSKIDASERFLFRLGGGKIDVTGNVKEDKKGKGSVDLYIKHIFVETIVVDPERRFSGWVNCNALTPTTARNDILRNEIFDDFFVHLKQFVRRFPKIEEEIGKDEMLLGNELEKLLKNYLSDMKLLPQGTILIGRGKEDSLDKQHKKSSEKKPVEPSEEPEYIKLHTQRKTNKPIKRTSKTDYGVMWVDQDYGNDKEPLFYVKPNVIVRNRTNDLYKFALKNKPSLGPKWLRLSPFLSRLAVTMNPSSEKWNREEMYLKMDEAIRYFLRHKEEL